MPETAENITAPADFDMAAYRKAAALDLRLLAWLQSHELDEKSFLALKSHPFGHHMALEPASEQAHRALQLIDNGWPLIGTGDAGRATDILAADFAAIFLTYKLRASPCESVWFDDEHLMRQKSMFDVRAWYERYGMRANDWRCLPDDHICLQLEFIAHLLDDRRLELEEIARFLDEHLLRWVDDFARRVSERCETLFYAALVPLCAASIEELRDAIELATGYARPQEDREENHLKEALDEIRI